MLLSLDIGNSSVSFALFDINDPSCPLIVSSKISCTKNRSCDEYAVMIRNILDLKIQSDKYKITCAAISSVVPSVTRSVANAAKILCGSDPFIVGPGIRTGFKISINDPAALGSDIVANVAAALQIANSPLVVFDAGTANTVTVVDNSNTLIGTAIMPGIRVSADALSNNAELLDSISLDSKDLPLIGKTTDQSVRSGLIYGNALMLDGYIRNIRESIIPKDSDCKLGLIATGGFAEMITSKCRNKFIVDDSLTLRGIAALYLINRK